MQLESSLWMCVQAATHTVLERARMPTVPPRVTRARQTSSL